MEICDSCKKEISFGSINLCGEEKKEVLCFDCFNGKVAERIGIDKPFTNFKPITMTDAGGLKHTFHIQSMLTVGLGLTAIEVENDKFKSYGYRFGVMVHPETDPMEAFQELYIKMKQGLSRTHIIADKKSGMSSLDLNKDDTIIGRIEDENDDIDHPELYFSIDGKKYSSRDLHRILNTYAGFNFKLVIYDPCEEIPYERKKDIKDQMPWADFEDNDE